MIKRGVEMFESGKRIYTTLEIVLPSSLRYTKKKPGIQIRVTIQIDSGQNTEYKLENTRNTAWVG